MPKDISSDLLAHIAGEVTTLATCWEITRRDGTVFYFTDHDRDLIIDGHTYLAAVGYTRSSMAANSDFTLDNIDLKGIFDNDTMTAQDLRDGLFDNAQARLFVVNWADLTQGKMKLRRALLGDINATPSGVFDTTLYGFAQQLNHLVGDLYTPTCRADLGDTKCKIDLAGGGWLKTATVATVTDQQTFTITVTEPRAVDGWFKGGVVSFTSGDNDGRSMEVKAWTQATSTVGLFLPMSRTITVGDTLTIYPGCNKQVPDCRDKFDNIVNMRAEPYVPGIDYLAKTPPSLQ